MIRVGLVGLDSSHPDAFADYLEDRDGVTVAAVWDGGAVRSPEYTETFGDRYEASVYNEPEAMIDAIDVAMVLTVDWDTHPRLAIPFLEAGIPTFIDKPLAGCVADIDAIASAADCGVGRAPLSGGSALPFHPSVSALPIGRPDRTIYYVGYDDPFYYGAHLTDSVRLLADCDWRAVRPTRGPGEVVHIEFENGTRATLQLDGTDRAFAVLDVSDRTRACTISGDNGYEEMYGQFLDRFLDTVRGVHDDTDRLLDGAMLLLAVRAALDSGSEVTPEADALHDTHADGGAFLADYEPYY